MTQTTLPRILGFRDLVLLTLGSVIGSGIFIVPASVLQSTGGRLGPALLVWTAGGVLSVLGALTYAELAAIKPDAGGIYVYIRDACGSFIAFLYGWALFFVISSATIATLAVAFAGYLGQFTPLSTWGARAVAAGMVVILAVINVIGTRQSANLQNWTTAIKVGAILLMSAFMLTAGDGLSEVRPLAATGESSLLLGMGAALIGVMWAYEGWHCITYSAGEAIDPQRTVGRAIVIGTALLIGIYLLANLAYVAALGPERSAHSNRIAAEAIDALLGPNAGRVLALVILISIFSAANATVLTATRVYFAMARDGIFFERMGDVHPRWQTPAFAVTVSCAWAAVMAACGGFEELLTYVVFAGWIFYALGAASIFHYRRLRTYAKPVFQTPGYPWTPLMFVLAAGVLVLNTVILQPGRALVGVALIMLGAPAFWFWRRKRKVDSQNNPVRVNL
jgi:APA family basic amino acid/polyamine antiporter